MVSWWGMRASIPRKPPGLLALTINFHIDSDVLFSTVLHLKMLSVTYAALLVNIAAYRWSQDGFSISPCTLFHTPLWTGLIELCRSSHLLHQT